VVGRQARQCVNSVGQCDVLNSGFGLSVGDPPWVPAWNEVSIGFLCYVKGLIMQVFCGVFLEVVFLFVLWRYDGAC
jgi:hypothetical protein